MRSSLQSASRRVSRAFAAWIVAGVFAAAPPVAGSQGISSGSIHGRVIDETNAALPGVAVTLTSPALQLRELAAVTDAEGGYSFRDLPPGVYSIKYELAGFQTVVRDAVRLNVGFAARIDVTLKIGEVQETLTVTGQAPVVDVTTTTGSTNFTKEMLEKIPTSRSMWQVLAMTPGVRVTSTPDVGGSTVGTQQSYSNYGTAGQVTPQLEGIDTREGVSGAGFYYDYTAFEEVQVKAVGNDAETALPGTNFVGIVKSGGNEFHGTFLASGQNARLQSNNIDDALRAQGITEGNPLSHYWDLGADLGGPIMRDKFWFYAAYRAQRVVNRVLGYSKTAGPDGIYGTPDDELGDDRTDLRNYTAKLSFQPGRRYRLIGFYQLNEKDQPEREADRFRPRESTQQAVFPPSAWKVEIQGTPSDSIIYNVRFGRHGFTGYRRPIRGVTEPTRFDRDTGRYTGVNENLFERTRIRWQSQGSISFFPKAFLGGDHAFKAGYAIASEFLGWYRANRPSGNYLLTYDRVGGRSFQPVEITTYNLPLNQNSGNRMTDYSAYVKDTWTLGRVTANLGLRWERYHSFLEEQTKPQGVFGESGTFPALDVLTWTAVAPRVGLSWDIGGNGRTVLKGTYGWYNYTMGDDFAEQFNKNGYVRTTYRWRDPDGNNDYTPGEVNLDPNGPDFLRLAGPRNNILNPDLKQPRTHEVSIGFERELAANFSAKALYVYKRQSHLYEFVNVLRPYSAYNIAVTRRDPGPDGVLGTPDDASSVTMYDYDPAFRGAAFVAFKPLNREGRDDSYQTIELTLNKRTSRNWDMITSFSATKNHRWLVGVPQSPNDEFFPLDSTWNWQLKVLGSYVWKYQIRTSAFFQHVSGDPGQRTYVFRQADPDRGLPLRQLGTVTLRLEPFGARREPNLNVLNLRASKTLALGNRVRMTLDVDVFNALNANDAAQIRYVSGPSFGAITQILPPRTGRFSATVTF